MSLKNNQNKDILIRIGGKLKEEVEYVAETDGITAKELVLKAIEKYLYKPPQQ